MSSTALPTKGPGGAYMEPPPASRYSSVPSDPFGFSQEPSPTEKMEVMAGGVPLPKQSPTDQQTEASKMIQSQEAFNRAAGQPRFVRPPDHFVHGASPAQSSDPYTHPPLTPRHMLPVDPYSQAPRTTMPQDQFKMQRMPGVHDPYSHQPRTPRPAGPAQDPYRQLSHQQVVAQEHSPNRPMLPMYNTPPATPRPEGPSQADLSDPYAQASLPMRQEGATMMRPEGLALAQRHDEHYSPPPLIQPNEERPGLHRSESLETFSPTTPLSRSEGMMLQRSESLNQIPPKSLPGYGPPGHPFSQSSNIRQMNPAFQRNPGAAMMQGPSPPQGFSAGGNATRGQHPKQVDPYAMQPGTPAPVGGDPQLPATRTMHPVMQEMMSSQRPPITDDRGSMIVSNRL